MEKPLFADNTAHEWHQTLGYKMGVEQGAQEKPAGDSVGDDNRDRHPHRHPWLRLRLLHSGPVGLSVVVSHLCFSFRLIQP